MCNRTVEFFSYTGFVVLLNKSNYSKSHSGTHIIMVTE